MVNHLGHTRRTPGNRFGLHALLPRAYAAAQNDLAFIGFDGDPLRIQACAALQRVLNFPVYVRWWFVWRNDNEVNHTGHAAQAADHLFGVLALILPRDLAI